LSKYVRLELDNLHAEDIRVEFTGRSQGLPKNVRKDLEAARELTKDNASMLVNFAVNYGSRT
ncbi:MAG: isoprenyl transferase, partial [Desulfuromonadales bacterium]|nr:isoprenyl transferase [Desulfuromonadales bacterium]NIS41615.1 isoprenyl transferase [Desulfuromonadales bacterium]